MGIINSEQINLKVNVRTCFGVKKRMPQGFCTLSKWVRGLTSKGRMCFKF